jgi:hypothetical protein
MREEKQNKIKINIKKRCIYLRNKIKIEKGKQI